MEVRISVDMNKKCSQCGHPGATQNGLCIKCVAKRIKIERMRHKEVRDEVPLC